MQVSNRDGAQLLHLLQEMEAEAPSKYIKLKLISEWTYKLIQGQLSDMTFISGTEEDIDYFHSIILANEYREMPLMLKGARNHDMLVSHLVHKILSPVTSIVIDYCSSSASLLHEKRPNPFYSSQQNASYEYLIQPDDAEAFLRCRRFELSYPLAETHHAFTLSVTATIFEALYQANSYSLSSATRKKILHFLLGQGASTTDCSSILHLATLPERGWECVDRLDPHGAYGPRMDFKVALRRWDENTKLIAADIQAFQTEAALIAEMKPQIQEKKSLEYSELHLDEFAIILHGLEEIESKVSSFAPGTKLPTLEKMECEAVATVTLKNLALLNINFYPRYDEQRNDRFRALVHTEQSLEDCQATLRKILPILTILDKIMPKLRDFLKSSHISSFLTDEQAVEEFAIRDKLNHFFEFLTWKQEEMQRLESDLRAAKQKESCLIQ